MCESHRSHDKSSGGTYRTPTFQECGPRGDDVVDDQDASAIERPASRNRPGQVSRPSPLAQARLIERRSIEPKDAGRRHRRSRAPDECVNGTVAPSTQGRRTRGRRHILEIHDRQRGLGPRSCEDVAQGRSERTRHVQAPGFLEAVKKCADHAAIPTAVPDGESLVFPGATESEVCGRCRQRRGQREAALVAEGAIVTAASGAHHGEQHRERVAQRVAGYIA